MFDHGESKPAAWSAISHWKPSVRGFERWYAQKATELRANYRLVVGDVLAVALSVPVAMLLAENGWGASDIATSVLPMVLVACLAAVVVFPLAGFYRSHTRTTSLRDLAVVLRGAVLAVAIVAIASMLLPFGDGVPVTVYIIQLLYVIPALGALRLVARRRELMRKKARALDAADDRIPVLVIGTGANSDLFIRSLRQPGAKYRPIGIIDDARGTMGLHFHDVKILGSLRETDDAITLVERQVEQPNQILLSEPMTNFENEGIRKLMAWASRRNITVARLPGIGEHDHSTGASGVSSPRSVDPEDILDRPQKQIERSLLKHLFEGRRVLITGAGGSIGSELCRQVASYDPALMVLIDHSEFNAYSIDMDLSKNFPDVPREMMIANIRDSRRVASIFEEFRPEIVFNAAALKHVPMVEMNPCEGILTNAIGTRNIADAARNVGAIAMVQVSTDKAVNATSVMGATKRVAEFYVQAQDRITNEIDEPTRFFSVRFGNVLGSSGSLIPLFQRQISEGGPLTVTDKRMERYFMTIREAVELTLVSAAMGLAKDTGLGEIFVLDMGKPVKIVDLAERMIRLAGLEPYKDIDIEIVGKRPGEKLFEELFDKAETRRESGIPGVRSALPDGVPISQLRAAIRRLEMAAQAGDQEAVRKLLSELVPGYGEKHMKALPLSEIKKTTASAKRALAPKLSDGIQSGESEKQAWAGE